MTLNLSDRQRKILVISLIALAVFFVWSYLSGGILMMLYGRKFDDTSLLLYPSYLLFGQEQEQLSRKLLISGGLALGILLLPLTLLLIKKKPGLHGDAHFATLREIKKASLWKNKQSPAILIGKYRGEYLQFPGAQHVLLSAPTRSGKGVSIIIPNLLQWSDSCVVLDIKMENWELTSGYRRKYGQECFLFNPGAIDGKTHRYNPLSYVSDEPAQRIDDLQKIANILFPDIQGTDPIWTATPRTLFLGIALYLFETPGKKRTIGQILWETLLSGDGALYFKAKIQERQDAGNPLSEICVRALNSYCSIDAPNTRAGIISSFRSRLELWLNPIMDAATSDNDFDLRDLRKKRMSIYVGVTPDNLQRMKPLLNIFFQQLIDVNVRELPSQNPALKYRCLLLMDEFIALGKVSALSEGIAYIAGYGLRCLTVVQSMSQLSGVYGREGAQTLQANHAMLITFSPKAADTSWTRDLSEMLGYQTVKSSTESKNIGLFQSGKHRSRNTSEQRRALMLPQEISTMSSERELIILENTPPILADKVCYYKDKQFVGRLKEIAPRLSAASLKQADLEAAMSRHMLAAPVKIIISPDELKEIESTRTDAEQQRLEEFANQVYELALKLNFPPGNTGDENTRYLYEKVVEAGYKNVLDSFDSKALDAALEKRFHG